jgi:hypothetical protein
LITLYNSRQNISQIETDLESLKNQNLTALKDIVTDILSHELDEMSKKDAIFEKKLQDTIDTIYNRLSDLDEKYQKLHKSRPTDLPNLKDLDQSESETSENRPVPPSTPRRERRVRRSVKKKESTSPKQVDASTVKTPDN